MTSFLSPQHLRVLGIIIASRLHGRGVTIRDIRKILHANSNSWIHQILVSLRRKGLVTWEEGKGRTLRPLVFFIPADQLETFPVGGTHGQVDQDSAELR